jgi:hypothetical protein
MGLWVLALSRSLDHGTDGFVSASAVLSIDPIDGPVRAAALVAAKLWRSAEGGYRFNDWADYNDQSDRARLKREQARERQRRHRQNRTLTDVTRDVTRDETRDTASLLTDVTRDVTRDETRDTASLLTDVTRDVTRDETRDTASLLTDVTRDVTRDETRDISKQSDDGAKSGKANAEGSPQSSPLPCDGSDSPSRTYTHAGARPSLSLSSSFSSSEDQERQRVYVTTHEGAEPVEASEPSPPSSASTPVAPKPSLVAVAGSPSLPAGGAAGVASVAPDSSIVVRPGDGEPDGIVSERIDLYISGPIESEPVGSSPVPLPLSLESRLLTELRRHPSLAAIATERFAQGLAIRCNGIGTTRTEGDTVTAIAITAEHAANQEAIGTPASGSALASYLSACARRAERERTTTRAASSPRSPRSTFKPAQPFTGEIFGPKPGTELF